MRPGSVYTLQRSCAMSDGQVNFKMRRTQGRRFSFGLGYRHIALSEAALVGITGTFDAVDVDRTKRRASTVRMINSPMKR